MAKSPSRAHRGCSPPSLTSLRRRDWRSGTRFARGYLRTENPLARYAESARSELLGLVHTLENPLGRIEYDVVGTASGLWYLEGSPMSDAVGTVDWVMLDAEIIRLEWFDTHGDVTGFTSGALTYER